MAESKADRGSGTTPSSQAGAASCAADLDIHQLVRQHYGSVYRYAFRLTGAPGDAEDLTQQTFLVAQQKLQQVREPEKVDRWLFAVLRSCFLKSFRKRRPVAAATVELDVESIPARAIDREEIDGELLQAAISELPDKYRLVVTMFYFEQLSYKEISAELSISIGTVMSRLSRAKGRLRQRLFGRQSDLSPAADTPPRPPAFTVM